jgi:hypothetical protein
VGDVMMPSTLIILNTGFFSSAKAQTLVTNKIKIKMEIIFFTMDLPLLSTATKN